MQTETLQDHRGQTCLSFTASFVIHDLICSRNLPKPRGISAGQSSTNQRDAQAPQRQS